MESDALGLLQLYNQAKTNNFSAASIASILSFSGTPVVPLQPPLFTRDLSESMSGPDVLLLQKILNSNADTQIALQGAGSSGYESDYFGGLTKKAVQKFQTKYGIANSSNSAYGTVGPRTRTKLQELAIMLHL
jgi:peptidoglycan hydrolase-like protein with peptidoglycan-binding domain